MVFQPTQTVLELRNLGLSGRDMLNQFVLFYVIKVIG